MLLIPYTKIIPYPFDVILEQYFDYEHVAHVHPWTLGEYVLVENRGHVLVYDQHWPADRGGKRPISRVVQTYEPPGDIWFEFISGKYRGTKVHSQLKPHPQGTEVIETYQIPRLPNWGWLRSLIKPLVIRQVERVWQEDLDVGVCIGGWPSTPKQARQPAHKAPCPLPPGTYSLGRITQFPAESLTVVNTAGGPVLVIHTTSPNGIQAMHPICPHTGGPLALGKLVDGCIVCPWHAARFDVTTGRARGGPAKVSLPVYETSVVQGELFVSVPATR